MNKVDIVHKITIDVEKGVSLSDFIERLMEIYEDEPDMMISESFSFNISNTFTGKVN